MKEQIIEIDNKSYSCLLSPITLTVVGECEVTQTVTTTDNGHKNKDFKVKNVKMFDNIIKHVNIIAIGYDKCNKFISGKCYQDSTILGVSNDIPNVFNNTLLMSL